MAHRHSCDRCRQQKVRCLQDDTQLGRSNTASRGQFIPSRCERCKKADVDCVYSCMCVTFGTVNQRPSRPTQTTIRREPDAQPDRSSGESWFRQGLAGVFCPQSGLGPNFIDLVATGPFPGINDSGAVQDFTDWDTVPQSFSSVSPLDSLATTAPSAVDAAGGTRAVSISPSTIQDGEDDGFDDLGDCLSSQLTELSRRAMRATRRLGSPSYSPPTVSAPEVNEAFVSTNTLIRIISNIVEIPSERGGTAPETAPIDNSLVFMALASHQHVLSLFRAICDAIRRYSKSLTSKKENRHQTQQEHQPSLHHGDVGPSSVAQFVMVLQLLMHLISRMDRSLFQARIISVATGSSESSTGGPVTSVLTPSTDDMVIDAGGGDKSNAAITSLLPQDSLPALAQAIIKAIPDEHEKLRQFIQDLQTEIEHSELS